MVGGAINVGQIINRASRPGSGPRVGRFRTSTARQPVATLATKDQAHDA
ncbi:hypothetical protein ACMYR2_2315 [Nitrobacter sp. TKz-YC01]